MPVGEIGFLLGNVLLAVGEHVNEHTHKMSCLLLKNFIIQGAQEHKITWQNNQHSKT